MKAKILFVQILVFCFVLSPAAFAADKRTPPPDLGNLKGVEAKAFYIGLDAVIWGYPSVFFEDFMRGRSLPDTEEVSGSPRSLINQFGRVRNLRGPEFKQIATPNNDTLYAQAFTDVSREPFILSVPQVEADRYYGMQIWDPNGDTFAYVGSRTTGRGAGHFAFVGANWDGELPEGVEPIKCLYNTFVIWGRIGVDGPDDLENARTIQDALRLTPLSQFGKSIEQVPPDAAFSEQRVAIEIPEDLPRGLEYYFKLARSLKFTPPKQGQDDVFFASLEKIGFSENGTTFNYQDLSEEQVSGMAKAYQYGLHLMDVESETVGEEVNGWRWSPKSGILGTDYLFRAAWAKWFTGGNAPDEAIYMDGRKDDQGQPFVGKKRYTMHFEADQLPRVDAFWSLSMYNLSDGSFVENSIKRYSIGDRTPGLKMNNDGSLTLYIQQEAPTEPKQKANWLPTPTDGFYMNLRLYVPDDSLIRGTWAPPPVKVMEVK